MHLSSFGQGVKTPCPPICDEFGTYEYIPIRKKTPREILAEQKQAAAQRDANAKHGVQDIEHSPIDNEFSSSDLKEAGPAPKEYHFPNLKPGPDGKVDWTPLGEMTGTRPTVNKYSLSRYSLDEWRSRNSNVLDNHIFTESNIIDYEAKTAMMAAFGNIDYMQQQNDGRLRQKAKDIFRWKAEVQNACKMISEEVELLEIERQRLKGAARVLMLPESISKECLDLRSNRATPDLVADVAEIELNKEMNLVGEVRDTLKATLQKVNEQLTIDKAAKHRIEYDWCDKTVAYETEAKNLGLTPKSSTIMFRPGATRHGDYTAPLEYWEYLCRENIENCESVRQASAYLRSSLNAILTNNGRKLRTQADKTDAALAETVAVTSQLCTKLKERLRETLQKIADLEKLIQKLQEAIRKTDAAMKLAQTRLDNRNYGRPHGEAVRDIPHIALIDEVKEIHETVTMLLGQLHNAEKARKELMEKRVVLEKSIASKKKTLDIDRDRCGMIRSHYPSATELAGL